jgi:type II secretory pathway pseudopilin PulG
MFWGMDPSCPNSARRPATAMTRLRDAGGYTVVEVLVAILIFAIAVLGALALINTANLTALTNKARTGGVNLAREVEEGSRAAGSSVPYGQLLNGCPSPGSLNNPCSTTSAIVTALQAQPGLAPDAGSPAGTWQVTRAGIVYTIKVAVCTMDDPADGLGAHTGAGFCSDNSPAGPADSDGDDYKRVSIQVDWGNTPGANTVRAVALINSSGTNGPGITCLRQTGSTCPNAPVITSATTTSVNFTATMTGTPVSLEWSVDGAYQGTVTPSGQTATFNWTLGTLGAAGSIVDGTYEISATAFDANGNAGNIGTVQVQINRRAPAAVTYLAGRNNIESGNGTIGGVDVEWLPSDDKDILYYRIYSKTGTNGTRVLEYQTTNTNEANWTDLTIAALPNYTGQSAWPTDCDPFPADPTPVYYWMVAVDQNGSTPREGTPTALTDVNACNHRPKTVTGFVKTANLDGTVTFSWDTPTAPVDPDVPAGDTILGYRIYRWDPTQHAASVSPGDRYEFLIPPNVTSCVAGSGTKPWPCWTDTVPRPNGVTLSYCVRAVDYHLQESAACSATLTY